MDVGKTIKALRLKEKLTQEQLASKVYLKQNTISQYENGRAINSDILSSILDSLGYKIVLIKRGDENMINGFLNISNEEWGEAFPVHKDDTPSLNNSSYEDRLINCYNCFESNISKGALEDYGNAMYYELTQDEYKDIVINAEVQIDEDEKICHIDIILSEDTTLEEFRALMQHLSSRTTNFVSETNYVEEDYYWRYDKW